jgi:hypothetical protein
VNYLKQELVDVRRQLADTKELCFARDLNGLSGRHFSPTAPTQHEWKIVPKPPLRQVDLVEVARRLSLSRGKRSLSNRDAISRFVKTALEELVPQEVVRDFTVRDRGNAREHPQDIGNHAKDQITGIVLELMGLYEMDKLDDRSRTDRAHFAHFVNCAMKTAM